MPYFTESLTGPRNSALEDYNSSPDLALSTAFEDAWEGNPSSVGFNYLKVQRANIIGPKLDGEAAAQMVKDAGVKLTIPEDGYTKDALDILIKRKSDEMRRQDILNRAPGGVLPTSARFLASLVTGLADPLNVASAFIPVIGEARYAELLAGTTGALGRATVRGGVGAAEGLAGAAALEPGIYYGRTQLQDDYHMSDSLLNLAFGTIMGGGLHMVGGAVGDMLRGPSKLPEPAPELGATPATTAPGVVLAPEHIARIQDIDRQIMAGTLTKEEFTKLYAKEPEAVQAALAARAGVEPSTLNAPFKRLTETTPESARQAAAGELTDTFKAELLGQAGNRAEPGDIPALRQQAKQLDYALAQQTEQSDARFRDLAKRYQSEGLSRKQAEAQAKKAFADQTAELQAQRSAIEDKINANRDASTAEQDLAKLNAGEIPERFAPQVEARANQIMMQSSIAKALELPTELSARHILAVVSPETREAAFRSALAQAISGKNVDVESVVHLDPAINRDGTKSLADVKTASERTESPASTAVADVNAARAADEKLALAPKDAGVETAEAELQRATERVTDLVKNLEQSGMDKERLGKLTEALKTFDDAIKDADSIGKAARAAAVCGLRS